MEEHSLRGFSGGGLLRSPQPSIQKAQCKECPLSREQSRLIRLSTEVSGVLEGDMLDLPDTHAANLRSGPVVFFWTV